MAFSNFGFMGNAVVAALFPEVFMEYLIFVLPFWIFIYLWGVPSLLMPADDGKADLRSSLRNLVNPLFIAMIIGMLAGIARIPVPAFLTSAVSSLGNCMSPIAMPLGLNTIVVPSAYGRDTSVAAGMALISHVLSCITIPVIFAFFRYIYTTKTGCPLF